MRNGSTPCNPAFASKKAILRKCGQMIPDTDIRKERMRITAEKQKEFELAQAQNKPGAKQAAAGSSSSNKKKKGKKGRR